MKKWHTSTAGEINSDYLNQHIHFLCHHWESQITISSLIVFLFWGGTKKARKRRVKWIWRRTQAENSPRQRGGPFCFSGAHCSVSLGSDEAHVSAALTTVKCPRCWPDGERRAYLTCPEAAALHTWLNTRRRGFPGSEPVLSCAPNKPWDG